MKYLLLPQQKTMGCLRAPSIVGIVVITLYQNILFIKAWFGWISSDEILYW